jgi:hypothetical protein
MPEYDDLELRSRLAALDADPRAEWVDAQRERLAASWKVERADPAAPLPPRERLEQRPAAIWRGRRTVRVACAIVAAVAIAVVGLVVTLPGTGHRSIQTPARTVPTTVPTRIPDGWKTHAIVVTPSTGLRDGQIVRVSGRFTPFIVQICRAGVTPPTAANDCDPQTFQFPTGNRADTGRNANPPLRRYPYMVRRMITLSSQPLGSQPLDCAAPPGCVLYGESGGRPKGPIHLRYPGKYGLAPLAFDPAAPPLPGPSVTVTPREGLHDGDAVTVQADHLRPFAGGGVTVCVSGTDVCDGVGVTNRTVGPDGSVSVTHPVWSQFSSADGTPQNCHSVACVVRLGGGGLPASVDVPVSFAPGSPAAYPRLTLDPAGPYTDGQQVTVTVAGWPGSIGNRPDLGIQSLTVGQCAPFGGDPNLGALCIGETSLHPEPDGRYTATLAVHGTGDSVNKPDCTQPGDCQVALVLTRDSGMIPIRIVILAVDVVVT